MPRKGLSLACTVVASVCLALSMVVQWGYTQAYSTETFVSTANTLATEPVVQREIAESLVEALTQEIPLPPFAITALQNAAERLVASPMFLTFWTEAMRTIHDPLLQQLTSDIDISMLSAQRVNLQPLIQTVLDDLTTQFPNLAPLLPREAPQASFALLRGESLSTARTVTSLVQTLRWLLPLLTIALFASAYFVQSRGGRQLNPLFLGITLSAAAVQMLAQLAPIIARSAASNDYSSVADTIAQHVTQPLVTQSLILALVSGAAYAALWIHRRRTI